MSFAELRGKLSPVTVNDRSEDLLTSDVFGTLHFVGAIEPLVNWLKSASFALNSSISAGDSFLASPVRSVAVVFWPSLPNGREPDVALLMTHADDQVSLILIEVKYFSGLSNFDVDADDRTECESSVEAGHQIVDQLIGMRQAGFGTLLKQWFGVGERFGGERHLVWAHYLITADRVLPTRHYAEVETILQMPAWRGGDPRPYWLSWHSLGPLLARSVCIENTAEERLVSHLCQLLRRKELGPFTFQVFQEGKGRKLSSTGAFWSNRVWFAVDASRRKSEAFEKNISFWRSHQ